MMEGVLSPKARRISKKNHKKRLKALAKASTSKKEIRKISKKIEMLDQCDAHPRRPRCNYFGEMVQMDASEFVWFGDTKAHLHVAIDDATGSLVGAHFDTQETLKGYYNTLHQILTTHGIPAMFYTDKRTVFEYKKKASPSQEDTFTQFSYACHQLGIEIKTTSIPQAKGRVERLNQTLQSRLPIEMKLKGISTIEEANIFLESYINKFNAEFSLPINSSKTVFEKQTTRSQINNILARIDNRVIDVGHSIRYMNQYYSIRSRMGKALFFPKGTKALVINAFDGSLFVSVNESLYCLEQISDYETYSKRFDVEDPEISKKQKYIPPLTHP